MEDCSSAAELDELLRPLWPRLDSLQVLLMVGSGLSQCILSPAAADSVAKLSQLRVLDAAALPMPTLPASLVDVRIQSVQWTSLAATIVQRWKRLERFDCEKCFHLQEVPEELLRLPRLSSISLIGPQFCDHEAVPEFPGGTLVCAGMSDHRCGVPNWIAHYFQEAKAVSTTVCASQCPRVFEVIKFSNINDKWWTIGEVASVYAAGEPEMVMGSGVLADDALQCLLGVPGNKIDLREMLRLRSQLSTCEQCEWFATEEDILANRDAQASSGIPDSCGKVGFQKEFFSVCTVPDPVSTCHAWCAIIPDAWARGDADRSGSLTAEELDQFIRTAGFPSQDGNWMACLEEVTTCVENGEISKSAVALVAAAAFQVASTTCEDCL